jgi:hypothetical protein
MNDDFVMPEPFDFATATNVSQGLNPDVFAEDGGREALEESIGGDTVAVNVSQDGPNQDDVAVGAAMDGATEQGGGVGSGANIGEDFGNTGEGEEGNDSQDVDPSAGMG